MRLRRPPDSTICAHWIKDREILKNDEERAMSAPISVTEIPQAYLFGQNSGSNVRGTEQPAEKRNLHRSSGQSILALISQILSQLRENVRYAFNALEQRKASAEKELSAKQTVCTAQIFAGCATIAFAVAGGAAAKF